MKRFSTIFATLIMVAIFIMPPVESRGQGTNDDPPPPPCTPDCPGVAWGALQVAPPMQISVCGQPCNVTVYYYKRSGICNGNQIREFQVVQVELASTCPQQCNPDQYLAQVTFFMHLFNIANFPFPPNGGCVTDRRASMSACQFVWYNQRTGKSYVIKCANAPECCVQQYRVCATSAGVVTSINTIPPNMTPPASCPPDDISGQQTPCKPSCNALKDLIDPYYGKGPVFTNDPTQGGATVIPNPAHGQTTIVSPEMPDGGALLMIYDTRGGSILNQRQSASKAGRYAFQIDAANMPGGAYYYVIRGDEGGFIGGSISVTK